MSAHCVKGKSHSIFTNINVKMEYGTAEWTCKVQDMILLLYGLWALGYVLVSPVAHNHVPGLSISELVDGELA